MVRPSPAVGSVFCAAMREQLREVERPGGAPEEHDAHDEADVAQLGDPERLHRGARRGGSRVPVADQEIRAQADQLPEDEHLEKVRRQDQPDHREGEERLVRVVPSERRRRLVVQVGHRVDLHQQGDQRDQHQHRHRQGVDHHPDRGQRPLVGRQPRPRDRGLGPTRPQEQRPHERGGHRDDGQPAGQPAGAPDGRHHGQQQEGREGQQENLQRRVGGGHLLSPAGGSSGRPPRSCAPGRWR